MVMSLHVAVTPVLLAAFLFVIRVSNTELRKYFPDLLLWALAIWAVIQTAAQSFIDVPYALDLWQLSRVMGALSIVLLAVSGSAAVLKLAATNIFTVKVKPSTLVLRLFCLGLLVTAYMRFIEPRI